MVVISTSGLTCNPSQEKAAAEAAESWLRNKGIEGADNVVITSSSDTRATAQAETDSGEDFVLDLVQKGGEWVVEACQPSATGQIGPECPFGASDSGSVYP